MGSLLTAIGKYVFQMGKNWATEKVMLNPNIYCGNAPCLNVIAVGKSGVGKSSFLNYLCGEDVFQTGIGEPVTQNSFDEKQFTTSDGILYNLIDTVGLENGVQANNCIKEVTSHIEKCDSKGNIYDWIHSVFYCFAASDRRIEPFELSYIRELQKVVDVVILLTKADSVDSSIIEALINQIKNELGHKVQVCPVCSISQTTRKGTSQRFGREEVLSRSFYGLWCKLAIKLPNDMMINFKDATDINDDFSSKWGDVDNISSRLQASYYRIVFNKHALEYLINSQDWNRDKVVKGCFDFYASLSNNAPKYFDSEGSKHQFDNLTIWYKNEFSDLYDKVKSRYNTVRNKKSAYNDTIFFDSKEKMEFMESCFDCLMACFKLETRLQVELESLRAAYASELRTYGSYCLLQ